MSVLTAPAGWWTRTDLDTSSSQRSASDGVRLWEEEGVERVALTAGWAPTAGAGFGHSLPRGKNKKIVFKHVIYSARLLQFIGSLRRVPLDSKKNQFFNSEAFGIES